MEKQSIDSNCRVQSKRNEGFENGISQPTAEHLAEHHEDLRFHDVVKLTQPYRLQQPFAFASANRKRERRSIGSTD